MFKNLISVVLLISLLIIPLAVTGCPKSEQPTPAPATVPKQSSPALTPKAEKVIAVSEFVEQALKGKYKKGDIVLVSGTVLRKYFPPTEILERGTVYYLFSLDLGPESSGYIVNVDFIPVDIWEVNMRNNYPTKSVGTGDTIVARGEYVFVSSANVERPSVFIITASLIR